MVRVCVCNSCNDRQTCGECGRCAHVDDVKHSNKTNVYASLNPGNERNVGVGDLSLKHSTESCYRNQVCSSLLYTLNSVFTARASLSSILAVHHLSSRGITHAIARLNVNVPFFLERIRIRSTGNGSGSVTAQRCPPINRIVFLRNKACNVMVDSLVLFPPDPPTFRTAARLGSIHSRQVDESPT